MARSLFRALRLVASSTTLLTLLAVSSVARADIAPNVCEVEHFKRYLGETCVTCDANAREPDACRDKHAPEGMVQRCYDSRGDGSWTEIWCHVGGKEPKAAPTVPVPEAKPEGKEPPATPAPATPAPATPTPATPTPASGCNLAGDPSSPHLLGLAALVLFGLRRRGSARGPRRSAPLARRPPSRPRGPQIASRLPNRSAMFRRRRQVGPPAIAT